MGTMIEAGVMMQSGFFLLKRGRSERHTVTTVCYSFREIFKMGDWLRNLKEEVHSF
jgi:hypothetical protein